ncbi:PDZ domain-containing protein [Aureispira sp. CCB-QB1]|uniref:PDZ domain-containing protein n=1 Tax=Aureispira sp. CCB-QB1 TaxID=1313421 RepID=UPI000696E525|nr:PDZ domain-containing protein [Aureispira sp. CCB-QB1]
MKTFFNRKAWIYGLSLTMITSSSSNSIFAQDSNTSTDHKVTTIEKNLNKNVRVFVNNAPSESYEGQIAYHWEPSQEEEIEVIDNKPKLGVLLKGNESGVVVLKTFPNTTAAEIGLQENDKIISIDGKKTANIANLHEIIQGHQVGDAIVVQYERDGATHTAASILRSTSQNHYLNHRQNYNYTYSWSSNSDGYLKENACEKLEKLYGKPFLGVYLSSPHTDGGDGARLSSIIKGTGAEAAVLKAEDKITKMDQTPIQSSKEAIQFIQSKKPGDQIQIQVVRDNKTMLIEATLGSWANNPRTAAKITKLEEYCAENQQEEQEMQESACERLAEMYNKPFLGVYLNHASNEDGSGARLSSIIKGTGAAAAVLKAEDKITKMDQTPISSTKEAIQFIQSKKPGDQIQIQVVRNNKTMLIEATLGSWANNPRTAAKITKLEEYCETNTFIQEETPIEAPKEDLPQNMKDLVLPTFETKAVMEVFPNPTADIVNIRFEGEKAPLTIQVLGLDGRTMFSKNIQNFEGNYNDQIDLSKYPSGTYLINLMHGEQQITKQVIVE